MFDGLKKVKRMFRIRNKALLLLGLVLLSIMIMNIIVDGRAEMLWLITAVFHPITVAYVLALVLFLFGVEIDWRDKTERLSDSGDTEIE